MSDSLEGLVINGKFRMVEPIGRGGMGAVYRAEQITLGRTVAVKVLRNKPGVVQVDPAFQRRFFLEASLCAKLSHPNIVTIYDFGRIEQLPEESYFMAMELLDGETLHTRLRKSGGALAIADALAIAHEIARGLREAHRHGIVHRDLKPGNVMLVPDADSGEKVKILDFGLVKQLEGEDREDLTQEGSFLGSPKYMSPEQIDRGDVDHRTDLYSLGVMLFQMLCGRVPYEGQSSMQVLLSHVASPIPWMKERNPAIEIPAPVEALVRRLLAKSPAERHANADELIRDLRALQSQLGLSSRTTRTTADQQIADALPPEPSNSLGPTSLAGRSASLPVEPPIRSRALATALVVVGLVALGSAGAVVMRRSHVDPTAASAMRTNPGVVHAALQNDPPSAPVIRIESSPAGAAVSEDGRTLGNTPLALPFDPSRTDARHFTVALAGFEPFTVVHPPSRESARIMANLVPSASPIAAIPDHDTTATQAPATNDHVAGASAPHADVAHNTTAAVHRNVHSGNHPAGAAASAAHTTPPGHPLDIMTER